MDAPTQLCSCPSCPTSSGSGGRTPFPGFCTQDTPPRDKEKTPHLRLELGLLLLQSLDSFHEERDLSEGQEPGHVRGTDGHHAAILVQHLEQAQTGPRDAARDPWMFQRLLLWFTCPLLIPFKPSDGSKETL